MCETVTNVNKQLLKSTPESLKTVESNLHLLVSAKQDGGVPVTSESQSYFQGHQSPQNINNHHQQQQQQQPPYVQKRESDGPHAGSELPYAFSNGNLEDVQKSRPFVCGECGKTYTQKCHLTAHSRVHSGIKPHTCLQCGKSFTQKHSLNTHMLLHQSDRPYTCTICKKSFTLKHHLVAHEKVHSREKPFECTECRQCFPLKRHLVTHQKFHAGERPYICKECGESFALEEHLQNHSRFHGSTDSFRCNNCGETFTRKFELLNHSRMFGHGYFPLICQVCGKEFLQKKTLISHMRSHASMNFNPQFQEKLPTPVQQTQQTEELCCTRCPVKFNSREALLIHEKFHDGDTSIFNDLFVLSQHQNFPMSFNSNNSYNSPTKSPNLGISQNNHNFNALMQMSMNNLLSNYSLDKHKPYVCNFCSKPFGTKHGLFHHNKRHPEGSCTEKPFSCPTCGKSFAQRNYLMLHERVHMERKPNLNANELNSRPNVENIVREGGNMERPQEHLPTQGNNSE